MNGNGDAKSRGDAARPTDRITRIETIPLKVPMERAASGSTLKLTHRCTIITRVHTDQGVVGECFNANDDDLAAPVLAMLHGEMAPRLIGLDVLAVEEAWSRMRKSAAPFLKDRRIALRAQALIDSAILDAVGKIAGLPLHVLWGEGKSSVPVVALGGYYREKDDLAALAAEVATLRAFGIEGLKLKVGGMTPAEDARRAEAVRKAGGPAFILACDANQGWTAREALDFAARTKDLGLAWFEEPCHWDNDRQQMALVRAVGGVPVAAGQCELTRFGCRDLMTAGAIDICNFDASWGGGPTEWRRIAALATAFDVRMIQHIEPHIGLTLAAGTRNADYAEVMLPWRDPFFYKLIANQPARPFVDGRYTMSAGPGWGMILDEDYIAHARRQDV